MFLLIPSTLLAKHKMAQVGPATNIMLSCIALVLVVFTVTGSTFSYFNFCIMKEYLHIPCPGCGVTTGLKSFLLFEFHEAFLSNPCSLFIGCGMLLSFIASLSHLLFKQLLSREVLLQFIRWQNLILAIALFINYIFTITKTFYLWL
jgi:hypothetical protein